MNRPAIFLLLLLQIFNQALIAQNHENIKGSLIIVGGALTSTNEAIYQKFIEFAGGKEVAKIGVIGISSSKPVWYSQQFKNDLLKNGLKDDQIDILPLAYKDDGTTEGFDESQWRNNANNKELAKKIENYTGIWFVGGTQTRTTEVLFEKDGGNTFVLDAIWKIYRNGAVLGGTSAGAAIMSSVMIAGGTSQGALLQGVTDKIFDGMQETGPLCTLRGFGFFQFGVVDQHFDRKARLGRLIVATYLNKSKSSLGFGIAENTAMLVDNVNQTIEPIGMGGISIVNLKATTKDSSLSVQGYKNIDYNYIETGDKFSLKTGEFQINPVKRLTNQREYYAIDETLANGVFSANGLAHSFVSFHLIDNKNATRVKSYCFDQTGKGVEIVFSKTPDSKGYWGYFDGLVEHYSFTGVKIDINPVMVGITPLKK